MSKVLKPKGAKEKILEAAVKVFSEKGYDKSSMKDISKEASVNKSLLFYYFNSKKNLYKEVVTSLFDDYYVAVLEEKRKLSSLINYKERLKKIVKFYLDFKRSFKDEYIGRLITHEMFYNNPDIAEFISGLMAKLRTPLVDLIDEGKEKGFFRDVDSVFYSIVFLGIIGMFCHAPKGLLPEYDDDVVYKNIIDFSLNGILSRGD